MMLPRNHPDRIRIVFDDHRGGHASAPAGHPRPASGPAGTRDHHLDLGGAPGRANTGDKLIGGLSHGRRRLHRRRRCVAHRGDGLHPGRHGQGAIHPGHLPAQLPVGPRWTGPGPLGPDHAPFTIDLDSRPTDWPRRAPATTAIPAIGATTRCCHRGTGDVLMARLREGRANTARGAAHFLGTGALRRGQRTTEGRRVLGVVPMMGCPLLHHHPPAQSPQALRGCLDFSAGWTAPPMCRDEHPVPAKPDAAPVSSGG